MVVVNYRLHSNVIAPKYIEDEALGVAWVIKNIDQFGCDTSWNYVYRFFIRGFLYLMVSIDQK